MKPYFAKYLPAKGHFHYVGAIIRFKKTGQLATVKQVGEDLNETEWEHVKLFLCSSDIQVGDLVFAEFQEEAGNVIDEEDLGYWKSKNSYKIIGLISPEATFIKEGDEFDEEQIRYCLIDYVRKDVWTHISKEHYDGLRNGWKIGVEIKCPHCGIFK